ncbi:MAG: hypothetical protein D4R88_00365 [Methanosarcinales archaeon]|nr:MAG: hypothetical protein D4R88_00365 [Methanosarcinales archaeon]
MFLTLKERIDSLCDYTYTFTLKTSRLRPDSIIPSQKDTNFTFKDLVDELRSGGEVRIQASAGKRLANSMGADLRQFGGTGSVEKAGRIYIDGDVASEMGMGMVAGIIYVKGNVEEPIGNIVEVVSDQQGFRKFRLITEILCNGMGKDTLIKNNFNEQKKHLGIGHVEAMSYHKYGVLKERLMRMRDGSVVVRKIGE